MKREHWPEVGWRRRRAWTEAWAGTVWAARRRSGYDVGLWRQGWKMGQRLASTEWVKGVGGPAAVRQRGESWRRGTATAGAGAGDGDGGGWGWRWWGLSGDESLMREIGRMMSLMRDERAWWDDEKKEKGFRGFEEHGRSWNKRMRYVLF